MIVEYARKIKVLDALSAKKAILKIIRHALNASLTQRNAWTVSAIMSVRNVHQITCCEHKLVQDQQRKFALNVQLLMGAQLVETMSV